MNKRIAYLCSADTISTSKKRRADAFEHDKAFAVMHKAFSRISRELIEVVWDSPDERWCRFEAAIVGSTWDYTSMRKRYLAALSHISQQTKLLNPLEAIIWNTDKSYLQELDNAGTILAPTVWPETASSKTIRALALSSPTGKLLAKPMVGACSERQRIFTHDDNIHVRWIKRERMMLQHFVADIIVEGEKSLVFFGKEFSHAVTKSPAPGDYRVQSLFGGTEARHSPDAIELEFARRIVSRIPFPTLYARVDIFKLDNAETALMELEISEPYLYLEFAPDECRGLADRYLQLLDAEK